MTDDPDIRMAQSVMDYIFRRLALDHLSAERRAELGIFTATERAAQVSSAYGDSVDEFDHEGAAASAPVEAKSGNVAETSAHVEVHSSAELLEAQQGKVADAPLCLTCGTKMRPAGSCYVCEGCGSTSGCS
ncbi:MAG: vitamin B12-dependent ribonucleotide reductase, partial [Mycobacterium sp.]|nr:vitamin B12-dependent ribonucleotide reductase [Mycobacterium sp.]